MRRFLIGTLLVGCAPDPAIEGRAALERLLVQAGDPLICTDRGDSIFELRDGEARMLVHLPDRSVARDAAVDLATSTALLDRTGPPWVGGCEAGADAFALPTDPDGVLVQPIRYGLLAWTPTDTGARDTVQLAVEVRFVALDDIMPLRARAWSDVTATRALE